MLWDVIVFVIQCLLHKQTRLSVSLMLGVTSHAHANAMYKNKKSGIYLLTPIGAFLIHVQ
jgi:hypothetical protein